MISCFHIFARLAQLVERHIDVVDVIGSNPVSRTLSVNIHKRACVCQDEKAGALCEFSEVKRRKGEHREAGSRKFFVRKIICDRILYRAP